MKEFVAQVLDGSMTVAKDAEMMINARIAQIDHLLSLQLNEIMHHAQFQKLEGSWRGLKYLMEQQRDRRRIEDSRLQRHQEGTAARHRESSRVRPERPL